VSVQSDGPAGDVTAPAARAPRPRTDPLPLRVPGPAGDPDQPATAPAWSHRAPATGRVPVSAGTPGTGSTARVPSTPPGPARSPGFAPSDETVVLPRFRTGEPDPVPRPVPATVPGVPRQPAVPVEHGLGPAERGMLIFVAALLGLGTVAVVATMGFGLSRGGTPAGVHPSGTASAPAPPVPAGPTAPTGSTAAASASASAGPSASRSTAAPRQLGTLGQGDLSGYCGSLGYTLRAPNEPARRQPPASPNWNCSRGVPSPGAIDIVPNQVCRWRYGDTGAYTPARNPQDALPWTCLT